MFIQNFNQLVSMDHRNFQVLWSKNSTVVSRISEKPELLIEGNEPKWAI